MRSTGDPVTADEAVTGGFWRVVPLDDGLARSPASIASFLEAAGSAALEQAGKILVRRT